MCFQLRLLLWLCADLCPCFAEEQSSVHNVCVCFLGLDCMLLTIVCK